jgi:hypothetical protein
MIHFRTLDGQNSATIRVLGNETWGNQTASILVPTREYLGRFRALHTFFFYLRDAALRQASEMIIYGGTVMPMTDLCTKCNQTVCGTGMAHHSASIPKLPSMWTWILPILVSFVI